MWFFMFTLLVVLAIGIFALTAVRVKNIASREGNVAPTLTVGLVLLLVVGMLAFWVLPSNNASATDDKGNPTQDASFSGSDCEKTPKVADDVDYGINNPQTMSFAATGGNLIGNGPPLDSSSASAAVKDLYSRTESNPKLTANLAYVMRLSGFTPNDETRDQVQADVAFLDARVASLVSDPQLWSQTRRAICIRLGDASMDADPYKDRDLTEIATRVTPVEAEGVLLPVTNVVLGRSTQPDGVRLLWINREVDESGERPNKFPIAVDVQYAWPVVVGEIPESAERPQPPSPEQAEQDQQFQQQQEQLSQQRQQGGGKDNSGGGSGSTKGRGGGSNINQHNGDQNGCTGTCGQGNNTSGNGSGSGTGGGSGGGGGSNCGVSCGGGGNSGGSGGGSGCGGSCGGGSTPTTSKPTTTVPKTTTTKPPSTTTTVPKTTTTTVPKTTTTTVPKTTTTTIVKGPDPGCDIPGFCD